MPPSTCHMVQSHAGAVSCPKTPSPCIVYRLDWQAQACIVYRSALLSSNQCTVSAVVNPQIFLNFMSITWVRIRQQSILSEIVSVFPTLGFEPREAPDGDRQLRAAPWQSVLLLGAG